MKHGSFFFFSKIKPISLNMLLCFSLKNGRDNRTISFGPKSTATAHANIGAQYDVGTSKASHLSDIKSAWKTVSENHEAIKLIIYLLRNQ